MLRVISDLSETQLAVNTDLLQISVEGDLTSVSVFHFMFCLKWANYSKKNSERESYCVRDGGAYVCVCVMEL